MNYSRKKLKRFICAMLAIVLVFSGVVIAPVQEVLAIDVQVPSNVRCGVGLKNAGYLTVSFVNKGDHIKKLKSNSKNLVVRQTYKVDSDYRDGKYSFLDFYATKKGKYTIKFDVHDANGIKYTSKSITVHANGTGKAITGAKIDGKNMISSTNYSSRYYTTKKSGKIKFSMATGCKIKKIEVLKLGKSGGTTTRGFKNGGKVTFGTYGYSYRNQNYSYTEWSKGLYAETIFKIYFEDSFTGKDRTATYSVIRPASKWL